MSDGELFRLGERINFALPLATLKPRRDEMRAVAHILGISQALAWRAWDHFTWGQ